MKVSSFCALLLLVVIAFTFFSFSVTIITCPSRFSDTVAKKCVDETTPIAASARKLKETVNRIKSNEKGDTGDRISLEDYNPVDPIPGGAKNVDPGPIEHGTPLMPFIPKSPPPSGQSNPGPGDYD
ncbi:unnamed protein product [Vicia faba]|uniref:Uncharacterized protein n=1 Tax=Vicia faba TaxID=3906 RepID=A0AAV1A6P9_VICFA|nr:unnamed protein product [Vicia faba]